MFLNEPMKRKIFQLLEFWIVKIYKTDNKTVWSNWKHFNFLFELFNFNLYVKAQFIIDYIYVHAYHLGLKIGADEGASILRN